MGTLSAQQPEFVRPDASFGLIVEADAARNHGTRAAQSDQAGEAIMSTTIERMGRRLRLGVVGGGPGSFIGTVHRAAARLG